MMYWPNGQKILAAARMVAEDDRLHAVYLSNFRCGPDSFLAHYVREEMRGKPYLQLEVDEHSADAGMITRCEAFLDSLQGEARAERREKQASAGGDLQGLPDAAGAPSTSPTCATAPTCWPPPPGPAASTRRSCPCRTRRTWSGAGSTPPRGNASP